MVVEVKAAVTAKPGEMSVQSFPYPEELPADAMIAKLRMAGICGTDHHMYSGHMSGIPWPIIQGHEIVAEAYEIGEKASDQIEVHGEKLSKGDRITWPAGITCGTCWGCRWLASNIRGALCENGRAYGISLTCKEPPHLFGAFSEYVYVRPDAWVYKLPEDVPDRAAVLVDTLSSVNGIDRALSGLPWAREGFMWGDTAVVQGAGPIGIMAALKFREYGASKIIMLGGPDFRLKMSEKFGVDHTINIEEYTRPEDRIKEVMKLTKGRGADVVLEGSGVSAAFPEGIEMTRRGGIYIEMGCFTDAGPVMVNPHRICFKDLTLIGQYGFGPHQYERDLWMIYKWWRNKEYPLEDLVSHEFRIEKTEEGILAHKSWKTMKCVVMP